jgi:hypothetical protein
VVDFSEAERIGFIQAFVRFWQRRNDSRTVNTLQEKAKKLLRGCQQHFRSSITRVARIAAIIPIEKQNEFSSLAKSLVKVNFESFEKIVSEIKCNFPKLNPWIDWWLRPEHAVMLFKSHREMGNSLWNSLPDTTNPEEALHFSMYSAMGKHQNFLVGLEKIYKWVEDLSKKYNAVLGKY